MNYGVTPAETNSQSNNSIGGRLVCSLEGTSPSVREQRRVSTLEQLGLLETGPNPIFDEAVQAISRLLAAPICLLSVFDRQKQIFKATMGLSSLGLMNQLAATRELPNSESFGIQVIDTAQPVMLANVSQHLTFSKSLLVQKYGVQAYLGVPLLTSDGQCIGTLEVMDMMPHKYTQQDLALLELNARWVISEHEKQCWLKHGKIQPITEEINAISSSQKKLQERINTLRTDLVSQLTQNLRNPLTTIAGMASMLSREIYGSLTHKQQEYANVVLNSSQDLLSLTNEIMELGTLECQSSELLLSPVDIEMLAQQSLKLVEDSCRKQKMKLILTVEPGSRIWVLDRNVIKQLLHYLALSLGKAAAEGSSLRLHISRKDTRLNVAMWISNPWLGENLPQTILNWGKQNNMLAQSFLPETIYGFEPMEHTFAVKNTALANESEVNIIRQELGLLLSQRLTEIHHGEMNIQGFQTNSYRFVLSFPTFEPD